MSLGAIEFRRTADALWTVTTLAVEGLVAAIGCVTVVYGPIWSVGRLYFLRGSNEVLAAEGFSNPQEQRMFSWVALCCVVLLPVSIWAGGHYDHRWYAAALFAGILYSWLTCVVFEWSIIALAKSVSSRMFRLLFILVLTFPSADGSNDDDCPTEASVQPEDRKMLSGNLAGIAFIGILALASVWIAVDITACSLFNWCG